jgi:hypothetical protein
MEIVRSLGDVLIARLLRRDHDGDRPRAKVTRLSREAASRCEDYPRREAARRQQLTRVKQ